MNIFNNKFIKSTGRFFSLFIITSLFCYSVFLAPTISTTNAATTIQNDGGINSSTDINTIDGQPYVPISEGNPGINYGGIELPPTDGYYDPYRETIPIDFSNTSNSNSNNTNNTNWVNPTPGSQGSQGSQGQSSQPGGLPSYYDQNWSSQNNQQSPVITPGQQTQAMLDQNGPKISTDCGISPIKGQWNYCLLAPLNGLIGEKTGSGKNVVEKFDISDGLSPFFFKIYRLGVMAAIGLSIVMISFGGIQLATTDTIGGTDSGRKKINAAFAGLFIALFSYVLLYTINPALVNNGSGDIFKKTEIKP
jgi:hypothetical protein